jgi:hypothetical protein
MPKPRPGSYRPGSHPYDVQRARVRDRLEQEGIAVDKQADERANEILQDQRGLRGVLRGDRGLGPKGEREPGEERR